MTNGAIKCHSTCPGLCIAVFNFTMVSFLTDLGSMNPNQQELLTEFNILLPKLLVSFFFKKICQVSMHNEKDNIHWSAATLSYPCSFYPKKLSPIRTGSWTSHGVPAGWCLYQSGSFMHILPLCDQIGIRKSQHLWLPVVFSRLSWAVFGACWGTCCHTQP